MYVHVTKGKMTRKCPEENPLCEHRSYVSVLYTEAVLNIILPKIAIHCGYYSK